MQFIGRLLKLVRDYAARKYGKFTGIWVRENGEGKGGHVHILMYVPAGLSLSGLTGKWVRLAGGKITVRVSRVRSIGGALITAENGGEYYRVNLAAVLSYVLKGASRDVGEGLELGRSGEGGLILGKRCGWSQNVGERARNLSA